MEYTGFFYAIGAAITWGLIYSLDQKILTTMSPMTLLFVNSVVTAILLLPFLFFDSGSVKDVLHSSKTNLWIIFLAVVLAAFANFFIYVAIKVLDAPTASIIEIAYPFFVVLFSYIFFHANPNIYFFIGGTLIFIGSVIVIRFA